jgi:hypothetical protein
VAADFVAATADDNDDVDDIVDDGGGKIIAAVVVGGEEEEVVVVKAEAGMKGGAVATICEESEDVDEAVPTVKELTEGFGASEVDDFVAAEAGS